MLEHSINIRNNNNSVSDSSSDNYEYKSVPYEEIEINEEQRDNESYDSKDESEKSLLNPSVKKEECFLPKKSKRLYWADCARIFSMLIIVLLHCAGYGFEQRLRKKGDDDWHIVCIYNCITRFGVPMFVLLSGTFILDPSKQFSFKKLFCHNIFRLVTAFIFWSAINVVIHIYVVKDIKPDEYLSHFIIGEEYLWFIYMIIGCYIISPFLRLFSDNVVLARYFLALCVIWGSLIPTVKNVFNILKMQKTENDIDLWVERWHYHFTLEFVGYFVGGYHLVKHVNIRSALVRVILYILAILDVIMICKVTQYAERNKGQRYSKHVRDTNTLSIAFYAVVVFIFFKHEIGRINFSERAICIINKLSSLTFGVYLCHLIVKRLISLMFDVNPSHFFGIPVKPVIGIPICFVIVSILSFGISYLLSITPILKKYVL